MQAQVEALRQNGARAAFLNSSQSLDKEMAIRKPASRAAMLQVTGVGAHKFEQYGERFLNAIKGSITRGPGSARV